MKRIFLAVVFAVGFAGGYGYVENIVKLVHAHAIGEIVVRAFGIVMPLVGAVAGWC